MTDADRFRQEAEECRTLAASAKTVPDKEAWLRLAADWLNWPKTLSSDGGSGRAKSKAASDGGLFHSRIWLAGF